MYRGNHSGGALIDWSSAEEGCLHSKMRFLNTCGVGGAKGAALAGALKCMAVVAVVAVRVRLPARQPVRLEVCHTKADACTWGMDALREPCRAIYVERRICRT